MENIVNDRLKIFIDSIKISQVDFGRKIGISKQQIGSWLKDGVKIPVVSLSIIIKEHPELNARWLMTGEGDMIISSEKNMYKLEESTPEVCSEKITVYSCKDCISKQHEIDALKMALEAKDELLDVYRNKYYRKNDL